jgi:hypothetical protein
MNRIAYWFLIPMLIANGISLLGGHHARTGGLVSWRGCSGSTLIC